MPDFPKCLGAGEGEEGGGGGGGVVEEVEARAEVGDQERVVDHPGLEADGQGRAETIGHVEQDVGERVGRGVGQADFAAQRAHGDQSTYHGEFAYVVADLIKQGAKVGCEAAGAGQFAVQEVENERGDEQYERQAWEGNDQGRNGESEWNLAER